MKHSKHSITSSHLLNFDDKRRKALKTLKDLSLLGIGSSMAINLYKHRGYNNSEALDNQEYFLSDSLHTNKDMQILTSMQSKNLESNILTYPFTSNLPQEILSLPLKYFNIPQVISSILSQSSTKQKYNDRMFILPLLTSKDFNHTHYSLYHQYNVENINQFKIYNQTSKFLQYHYNTLHSLLKDLQSHNFIIRDFRDLTQDSKPQISTIQDMLKLIIIDEMRDDKITFNKQLPDFTFFNDKTINTQGDIRDRSIRLSLDNILKYQVPSSKDKESLYQQFKALQNSKDKSAIDAYNEILTILYEYKNYYFTNKLHKDDTTGRINITRDRNKARRLLQCLNTIGQNNIKALYVGINDDRPKNNQSTPPTKTSNQNTNSNQEQKRPKLIGRLATTIIIEDGLWLG